jgi:hypothetical protein
MNAKEAIANGDLKLIQLFLDAWELDHPIPFVPNETDEQRWARRFKIRTDER